MSNDKLEWYIVIGPLCWGRATDQTTALLNALRECALGNRRSSSDKLRFEFYAVGENDRVTGMGGIRYHKDHPPEHLKTMQIPIKTIDAFQDVLGELQYGDDVETKYHDKE